MDAILDARNAKTAAAVRGRAVSVVDPLPFDACGDRRALLVNALDDVLERRFLDTVRAPFRTLVDEERRAGPVRSRAFGGRPALPGTARERGSTHVCPLDARVPVAARRRRREHVRGAALRRRRHVHFNQCERRDTSDAFRGALRRSTIDFMKRVGAATPEASLADVLDGAACAYVRCLRPSRLRADLRAARVVWAARAAAAAHPRHALSFDALAGALSEAALAAHGGRGPGAPGGLRARRRGRRRRVGPREDGRVLRHGSGGGRGPAKGRAGRRPTSSRRERASSPYTSACAGAARPRRPRRPTRPRTRSSRSATRSRATAAAAGDPWRRPPPPRPGARAPVGGPCRGCAVAASAAASRAAAAAARGRDAGEGAAAAARAAAARHTASCAADLAAARAADALYVDPDALAIELAAAGLRKAPARDDPPPAPAGHKRARRPRRSAGSASTAAGGGPSSGATPC